MSTWSPYRIAVLVGCSLAFQGSVLAAPEPQGLGDPGVMQSLVIETGRSADGRFTLCGPDASQQLLVTGKYATGQLRDLTRKARYTVQPAGVVAVSTDGLVTPLGDGTATISVQLPGTAPASVSVTVAHVAQERLVQFANEVVPIFTKFGCNAGGCHGKASGQNGFKLSLFGFEPTEDYEAIVKEGRGRRLFPAAPASSLLLLKATGAVAHAGGKKLDPNGASYRTLLRWIRQGTPVVRQDDPTLRRIEVLPVERLVDRGGEQQLTVIAHLSDGSTADITRLALFDANNSELATVSGTGLVSAQQRPGIGAVMVRFQEHAAVFRAVIPLGAPVNQLPPARNFIDELVFRQLKQLGLPPSDLVDDGSFLRRATLDLCGRLPTKAETAEFLANAKADKYGQLIDRLLASGAYGDYFANKWSAILRNRRRAPNEDPKPTAAFHQWIRTSLQENRPYDQFVREVLTATGTINDVPQVVWYREVKEPTAQVEDTAQLFLGQRIACARCHHHPFEKWSQHDYWSMAAFFSRVEVKEPAAKGKGKTPPAAEPVQVRHQPGPAQALNPKTNRSVPPTGLGGTAVSVNPDDDPRPKLVDWMTEPDNPFFAKALVNRYWKHFFGRGLVEPEDDLRITNPSANAALLDALAKHFIASKYDLKQLIRTICTSSVYRLSAEPNAYNAEDQQNFSRFMPRRLHAEALLDAIDDVTLSRTVFKGMPAGTRAVQLPDNQVDSYFLSVFGRPDSASACECERSSDATLAQCLHLFNSEELLEKISGRKPASPAPSAVDAKGKGPQPKPAAGPSVQVGGRLRELVGDKRPDPEKLRDLYLIALCREPSKGEIESLLAHIEKRKDNPSAAYEDILWSILNTKEFLFNH